MKKDEHAIIPDYDRVWYLPRSLRLFYASGECMADLDGREPFSYKDVILNVLGGALGIGMGLALRKRSA